jgi:hypothetical protein
MPTHPGAERLQDRAAEAKKPQLAKHYREIGPAAVVAALICVRKDHKPPVPAGFASARLGKAA